MEYKIAILGGKETVRGFQALGVDTLEVSEEDEAAMVLETAYASGQYAIVFLTEDWADRIQKTVHALPPQALPAVVAVPSHKGSTGAGLRNLSRIVEQAVGSDILKIGES